MDNEVVVELYTPVIKDQTLTGVLITGIGLHRWLTNGVSESIRKKYLMNIVDAGGNTLVSTSSHQMIDTRFSYGLPLEPPGSGIRLQAVAFDAGRGLGERLMLAGLLAMSLTSLLSLALLWRSGRDRMRLEAERDRLFVLSQDVLCVLTPNGTVIRGNPAFEEYFGSDVADTVLYDRIHPDERNAVKKALSGPLRSHRPARVPRPPAQHLALAELVDQRRPPRPRAAAVCGRARHHAPQADRARARRRDRLPAGDGGFDQHRHAGDRPGQPHHLRQPRLLPHDRLRGVGAGRPDAALSVLAAGGRGDQPAATCA